MLLPISLLSRSVFHIFLLKQNCHPFINLKWPFAVIPFSTAGPHTALLEGQGIWDVSSLHQRDSAAIWDELQWDLGLTQKGVGLCWDLKRIKAQKPVRDHPQNSVTESFPEEK